MKRVIKILCMKMTELFSFKKKLNTKGTNILKPTIEISKPNIKSIILILNIFNYKNPIVFCLLTFIFLS